MLATKLMPMRKILERYSRGVNPGKCEGVRRVREHSLKVVDLLVAQNIFVEQSCGSNSKFHVNDEQMSMGPSLQVEVPREQTMRC